MNEVETRRLLLRRWRSEDLDPYARICADAEAMQYIGSGAPLTREQSEAQISRFVRHWDEHGFGLWAVEHRTSGAFVGFVGFVHQDEWIEGEHKTEVGWRLDPAYWGRGFGTEGAVERDLAARRREGWADPTRRGPLAGQRRELVRHRPRGMV